MRYRGENCLKEGAGVTFEWIEMGKSNQGIRDEVRARESVLYILRWKFDVGKERRCSPIFTPIT